MSQFGRYHDDEQGKFSPENVEIANRDVKSTFTPFEGFTAQFLNPNMTGALLDKAKMYMLGNSDSKKLSPEEIKNQFGFDTDETLNYEQANLIRNRRNREAEYNQIMGNIDPYAFGNRALPVMGALANGIMDPVAIGVGLVFDKGITAGGAMLANIAKVKTSFSALSRGTQVGLGVARGSTAGLAEGYLDDFVMKNHAKQVGLQYSDTDSFLNITLSTVAGGVLDGLATGLSSVKSRANRMAQESMAGFENGKSPKVDYISNLYDKDRYQRSNRGQVDTPSNFQPEDGVYYAAHSANTNKLDYSTQRTFETPIGGKGLFIVNNKDFAFNEATSSIEGNAGQLLTINTKELDLLDMDAPLPPNIEEALKVRFKELDIDVPLDGTLGDVLSDIKTMGDTTGQAQFKDIADKVNEILAEVTGVDGYSFRVKDSKGKGVGPNSNRGAFLFNQDKLSVSELEEVNSKLANQRTTVDKEVKQAADYYQSKESDLFYDKEQNDDFISQDPLPRIPDVKEEISKAEVEIQTLMEEDLAFLDTLEDSKVKKEVKAIREKLQARPQDLVERAAKAAAVCVRNS